MERRYSTIVGLQSELLLELLFDELLLECDVLEELLLELDVFEELELSFDDEPELLLLPLAQNVPSILQA